MSTKQKPIVVIGAGMWGTALALVLARNGNDVRFWGNIPEQQNAMRADRENKQYLPGIPFPDSLTVVDTLKEALNDTTDVMIVVPSNAFRIVIQQLRDVIEAPRIAWGTKGVDPKTRHLLHQLVFEAYSDKTPVAVLAGPSFAKEVADGKPTAVSLAGNDDRFTDDLMARFHNQHFRVYKNNDMIGLELCGTLKNILAIAVGISDGLELGANTRAALITRGLVEMGRLCKAMGADKNTLLSLAGVGDLVLTCTDDQSRNRRFGKAIGQGDDRETAEKNIGQAVEGLHNVEQVHVLAQQYGVEMPITEQVHRILFESADPHQVVSDLLSRVPKSE